MLFPPVLQFFIFISPIIFWGKLAVKPVINLTKSIKNKFVGIKVNHKLIEFI